MLLQTGPHKKSPEGLFYYQHPIFYQPIPQTVTVEFDLVYAQAALNFIRSIIAALTKGAPLVA